MALEHSHLLDALPGMIWIAHLDGRAEFLNHRWCEYTGLAREEAVGYGWHSAIDPEDLPPLLTVWRSFLDSGRAGELEARLRRFDGTYRRFRVSAAPISDTSGRVVKWCGINTDIGDLTESQRIADALKVSEAELRQAHAHFTVAQQLSATGSFISDLRADEHTWSDEFFRICEFEPQSNISTQRLRSLVHPEDLPSFDAVIERGSAGHDVDFEFRIITARGATKYLRGAARVSQHVAGRPLFMGAIQDVTESKVGEAALRASEAALRRSHDHLTEAQRLSQTGSYTADLLGDQHFWSEEFYRICEFEPGSKVTTQRLRDIVHPDDVPSFESAMTQALGGTDPAFYFRIVTSRGVMKHLRGVAHLKGQVADRPVFVGAVQDVTSSKAAENALHVARAELARVSRALTLGALTASIAHEVNQPLSGIITNASTCIRMLTADPPNTAGALGTAQRTLRDGNRASEVIKRLRAMFVRNEPTIEQVDLNDTAREVLTLSSSELQHSRTVLRTELEPDLPSVRGDRVQLQQVILNLILNAADAMRTVDDRPRDLYITTSRTAPNHVQLSVRDSGTGIELNDSEKLFEAFYTTKSHGMGVGLSISRSIIEGHGGRLWANNNDGPGATFVFSLPCATHD